ncbi:MAG: hypothetical protein ACKOHG_16180, partial [Planctomycetia bacterium]
AAREKRPDLHHHIELAGPVLDREPGRGHLHGRDLAESLGTRAVMESLVRTAVGPFARGVCLALDAVTPDTARAALLPAAAAVAHLPQTVLVDDELASAVRGGLMQLPDTPGPAVAALDASGQLIGILKRLDSGSYRLRPNFLGEG